MYVGRDFDPATPGESENYTLDFVKDLATNEGVLSATWSCTTAKGVDANASSRLVGAPVCVGQKTTQRVAGLLAGVRYTLEAKVLTTLGNTVSLHSHVTCANPT